MNTIKWSLIRMPLRIKWILRLRFYICWRRDAHDEVSSWRKKKNSCTTTGRVNTDIKGGESSYNHGDATRCVEYYSASEEREQRPSRTLKNSNETTEPIVSHQRSIFKRKKKEGALLIPLDEQYLGSKSLKEKTSEFVDMAQLRSVSSPHCKSVNLTLNPRCDISQLPTNGIKNYPAIKTKLRGIGAPKDLFFSSKGQKTRRTTSNRSTRRVKLENNFLCDAGPMIYFSSPTSGGGKRYN